jgi:Putative porin
MKPGTKRKLTMMLMFLAVSSAMLVAQTPSTTTTTKTRTTTKKTIKPAAKPAVTAADVQALKDALAAQQQQIQQLQQQLQARDAAFQQSQQQAKQALQQAQATATEAQSKVAAIENVATKEKTSVEKLSSDLADVKTNLTNAAVSAQEDQRRVSAVEGLVSRFRLVGDVRLRGENFFQTYSGCTACNDRNRARVRVRFGVEGKLNEDFVGGISIATGSLADPTTTNETFTNFFDRKTIGLDRGYITYNPVAHKWLSLTGGKFAYQWQRTGLTMDQDINPEGFDEKLSFDLNRGVLKNFTAQAMQLLLNENTNTGFLSAHDAFAVGGQVSGKLDFGYFTSTPSAMVLAFHNQDELLNASAFAVQATTTGASGTTPIPPLPVPGEGPGCQAPKNGVTLSAFAPCAFSPNGLTNSTFIGPDGKPHYTSGFTYGDLILNNQFKTGLARFPFNLLLEAEQNLRAAGHPLSPPTSKTPDGVLRRDLGRQSHGYLIDASLGQLRNRNDIQVGYAWERLEQDAIISSFAESDQRAPSNILQHRIYGLWKLRSNVVASYTLWIGRTLNPNLENAVLAPGWSTNLGPNEPWLKRMQFDLIYTF